MARDRIARSLAGMLSLAMLLVAVMAAGVGCAPSTGAAGAGSDAGGDSPESLTIAIAGMVTPDEGLAYYRGLAEYMGRKVGLPVRLIHKADYAQVNDMLEQGKVDVAFVCSGPYVAAHDKFGLELLGAPVVKGQPRYYAYVIVPKSSEATSLASLRGATFAFTDPQSNTGYGVPTGMLADMGEKPDSFFGRFYFTYSHDVSIRNVATGEADGASVDSLIFDYAAASDPKYTSQVRIITRSEPYAVPPVVVRPGLEKGLKDRLRAALLGSSGDAEGSALLQKMHIDRFEAIDDAAYDSIRALNARNQKSAK